MKLKIETLSIEQFRAFRQLSIQGLGRVNLITGRNNTGKTSVLEALRLLASGGSPAVIYEILRSREEYTRDSEEIGRPTESPVFALSSLFHGFPQFSSELAPIRILANSESRRMSLSVEAVWTTFEEGSDGPARRVVRQPSLPGEADDLSPALLLDVDGASRVLPLESFHRYIRSRSVFIPSETRVPTVFVNPYGGEGTGSLGGLWDSIALSEGEQDVVEALRIIDARISAVSMVGGEGTRLGRTAIVKAEGIARPVPLRSFGDGLNRLFGIVLSLVNAKDGLLLIDEFENGLHHSVQADIWRVIFRLATRLNVQVVATSHSWDAVEAFQKAANLDPAKGVLIRLTQRGDNTVPTVFSEAELKVATRDRIEVR